MNRNQHEREALMGREDGEDKLKEECGVFGVSLLDPHKRAAPLVYSGLLSLQHRGQESAGIAAVTGTTIESRRGMGLVPRVFSPELIDGIEGASAIGHVRYSTSTSVTLDNAQPFVNHFRLGSIAIAHNGALTNADLVRELLEDSGISFSSTSDSEVIIHLIAKHFRKGLEKAVIDAMHFIKGSYALVVLSSDTLAGARDPNGIRPLCLGRIPAPSQQGDQENHERGDWILASESCAIDAVGGVFVRDVEPGEMVIIKDGQLRSVIFSEKTRRAYCAFEYIYLARPDSVIDKIDVYSSRVRAGEILGKESPVEADLVIGVPDSGIPSAIGYGRATGTPFGMGIVKSRFVGRAFIASRESQREETVMVKHNAIAGEVRGKRVVVIDDSIVRGTTSRRLAEILRAAGAKEVHMRICSPPVRCPCFFGIDTPHRKDLISNVASPDEICKALGLDSLDFISNEGLLESLQSIKAGGMSPEDSYCLGCFTGEYPIPVPGESG